MTTLADQLAGGSRYIKWDELNVGASVTGTITAIDMRQARKYQSTDLDFWEDGKPKMQAVITLQTTLRDPSDPEDDGTRNVSINLWSGQKRALAEACKKVNVAEPQVGQSFTATWTAGVGKSGDPRVFSYTLGPAPAGLSGALGTVDTATGEITAPTTEIDPAAAAAAIANLTPEQKKLLGLG